MTRPHSASPPSPSEIRLLKSLDGDGKVRDVPTYLGFLNSVSAKTDVFLALYALSVTSNSKILNEFVAGRDDRREGLLLLRGWLKKALEISDSETINLVLTILSKLPVRPNDLAKSKIGKTANSVARTTSLPVDVCDKAKSLVTSWRSMVGVDERSSVVVAVSSSSKRAKKKDALSASLETANQNANELRAAASSTFSKTISAAAAAPSVVDARNATTSSEEKRKRTTSPKPSSEKKRVKWADDASDDDESPKRKTNYGGWGLEDSVEIPSVHVSEEQDSNLAHKLSELAANVLRAQRASSTGAV